MINWIKEIDDSSQIYDCKDTSNQIAESCYEPLTNDNDIVDDPIDGACCENLSNNAAVCCSVRVVVDLSKATRASLALT